MRARPLPETLCYENGERDTNLVEDRWVIGSISDHMSVQADSSHYRSQEDVRVMRLLTQNLDRAPY